MTQPDTTSTPYRRLYTEIWGNGSKVEVLFYDEPIPNEDPSDRIHLLVTSGANDTRGWLVNAEDAMGIIRGLAIGVQEVIEKRVPTRPDEQQAPHSS